MKRGGTYLQSYNCQIAVDGANQVIVAEGVTNQAPDQEHLVPMMERVRRNIGRSPTRLTADAGYMSEDNVEFCERCGIDAYLAVSRDKHDTSRSEEAPSQDKKVWRAMREKLSTDQGRQIYSRRKAIAEPVFGQTKEARGFRRFSLRGLKKVRSEWTLVCLCSNLLKLVNVPLPSRQGTPQLA
jgi:IS5 family transposase